MNIDKKVTNFNKRQTMNNNTYEIFFYKGTKNITFLEHFHTHYEIYFYIGNIDAMFKIDDKMYNLKYGDIFIIPPGIAHCIVTDKQNLDSYKRIILWLDNNFLDSLNIFPDNIKYCFENAILKNNYLLRLEYSYFSQCLNMLSNVYNESLHFTDYSSSCISSYLTLLLANINRASKNEKNFYSKQPESDILMSEILAYVDENFAQKISLEEVAQTFFISKSTLSHIFKEHFGISFYTFVQKKRLVFAKNNILKGMPINKAFENCGFGDYSSFFRAFKKEYGTSPTHFKNITKI